MRRRLFLRAVMAVIALIALGLSACVAYLGYLYVSYQRDPSPKLYSQGPNAIWARHQWVGDARHPDEYAALVADLKRNKITDVFFHVGPLDAKGNIDPGLYPYANDLLAALDRDYPELRVQAWIGQIEGILDLDDAATLDNIVRTSSGFLDLGFDGIHYDIEPIHSGDERYLDLLHRTREATQSRGKLLSVAAEKPRPSGIWDPPARIFIKRLWSDGYYLEVAAEVDQIAVMMYDTTLPLDWMYGSLVAWETENLNKLLAGKVTLFMGVPTYEDERWNFNSDAENVNSSLRGIQKGLSHLDGAGLTDFGVAIYAEWTTDPDEWQTYRREWLNAPEETAAPAR